MQKTYPKRKYFSFVCKESKKKEVKNLYMLNVCWTNRDETEFGDQKKEIFVPNILIFCVYNTYVCI